MHPRSFAERQDRWPRPDLGECGAQRQAQKILVGRKSLAGSQRQVRFEIRHANRDLWVTSAQLKKLLGEISKAGFKYYTLASDLDKITPPE